MKSIWLHPQSAIITQTNLACIEQMVVLVVTPTLVGELYVHVLDLAMELRHCDL